MSSDRHSSSGSTSRWIWPFELKERIGEGGMGVVYRARYVVNNREVAVKILPDDVKNPVVLARFERELEVLKGLKHPNIVRSFGGVCEDKHRFYAMELVEGGSLEDQLQERGHLPWEQVVEYGLEMCAALAYLHQHGVVHRDIKPANFLIDSEKRLKLSDFGLASVAAARRITAAGKTAGTILYMAPEQIRGGDITPQTDLYALGCVLYELLSGTPPFVGSTPAGTLNLHCNAPAPRVTQVALDCPVALEQLIIQLLEKDPKDRPASAVEVARALRKVTPTLKVVTRTRPIDSDEVPNAAALGVRRFDARFKETRPVARATSTPRWLVVSAMIVIGALVIWVSRLRDAQDVARRSEALWLEASQDPNPAIRLHAMRSLGQLRTVSPEAVQRIALILNDESPDMRAGAAAALGNMGAHAQSRIPDLHKVLTNDPIDEVRGEAKAAFDAIQGDARPSGPGWLAVLSALALVVSAALILGRELLKSLIEDSAASPPPPVSVTSNIAERAT